MADPEDSREKQLAKQRARYRKWIAANAAWDRARRLAWREANPEEATERHRRNNAAWNAKNPERVAFLKQRHHAKRRGIPFLLTFEEWWEIWQVSGKWPERGTQRGCYVMARFGDVGPYAVGNVRICTVRENHADIRFTPAMLEAKSKALKVTWARKKAEAKHNLKASPKV